MVSTVDDQQLAAPVDGDTSREVERRVRRRTAIAPYSGDAVAGDRRDDPVLVDPADPLVQGVGDVDGARRVDHHTVRLPDLGQAGKMFVAAVAGGAGSGDGDDHAERVDLAHAVVVGVGDIDVAGRVDGDGRRLVESREIRGPAVTGVVTTSGTIATIAGNGTPGFAGDHGPATACELNAPWGVAVDTLNSIDIADTGNNLIRQVAA